MNYESSINVIISWNNFSVSILGGFFLHQCRQKKRAKSLNPKRTENDHWQSFKTN